MTVPICFLVTVVNDIAGGASRCETESKLTNQSDLIRLRPAFMQSDGTARPVHISKARAAW